MANGSQLLPTNGEVQNVVEKIVVRDATVPASGMVTVPKLGGLQGHDTVIGG